jgi:hypothetical protein
LRQTCTGHSLVLGRYFVLGKPSLSKRRPGDLSHHVRSPIRDRPVHLFFFCLFPPTTGEFSDLTSFSTLKEIPRSLFFKGNSTSSGHTLPSQHLPRLTLGNVPNPPPPPSAPPLDHLSSKTNCSAPPSALLWGGSRPTDWRCSKGREKGQKKKKTKKSQRAVVSKPTSAWDDPENQSRHAVTLSFHHGRRPRRGRSFDPPRSLRS